MKITFELVSYNEKQCCFELDEKIHSLVLDEEESTRYKLLKSSELELYHWLKETNSFLNYMNKEVYQENENKKFAMSDINGISFRRFYFFKVTSGDTHYEYFKRLFTIHEESDWQDREDIGEEILRCLSTKREELILELG